MKNLLAVLLACVSAAFTSSSLANDDPAMAIAMVDKGLSYEIEKKSTYFVKSGDVILEAGIYKGK